MPLGARTTRKVAIIAWPALFAALMMFSFSAGASACPVRADRGCQATAAWSAGSEVMGLVLVPHAPRLRQVDATPLPRIKITDRTPVLRSAEVLVDAPKTSPPR